MALPTSSLWTLADFDEAAIGTLLALGPGDVVVSPSAVPYFSYSPDYKTLIARSDDKAEARLTFNTPIPARFTLEFVARFPAMPHSSGDLEGHRAGFVVADDAGRGVSIYFSKNGIAVSRVGEFGSVTALPDTAVETAEINTGFKTIRVAVDSGLGRAYVYIGNGDTTNPPFRFIVPVEKTPDTVADTFALFLRGSAAQPAQVELRRIQLAGSLIIPNFPPVADAGPDRVAAVGQSVRFDGRASFDLEGAPLTYRWRVIDAPFGSLYAAEVSSGGTVDDGDGNSYTRHLSFAPGGLPGWVAEGDVLRIAGSRHVISAVNNAGGELLVEAETIPDDLTDEPFRVLRQSLLIEAGTPTPYALPDVQGIYRFELAVSDGEAESEPSDVLANIVGARTPFGLEPDVSLLWRALGDEWQFIENRRVFEEGWRAAAQLLGAKLLEAWQHHYNFSIRDAQGTFQKKWVPLRSLVPEAGPSSARVSPRFGLLRAAHPFEAGTPAVAGETLVFERPTSPSAADTREITLTGNSLAQIVADCNAGLVGTGVTAYAHAVSHDNLAYRFDGVDGQTTDDGDGNRVTSLFSFPAGALAAWVAPGDTLVLAGERHTIAAVNNAGGELAVTEEALPDDLVSAPFRIWRNVRLAFKAAARGFRVLSSSTAAAALGIETGRFNYLDGASGARVTDLTYFAGDGVDLAELGVQHGDLLVLNNGQSFRVDRLLSGKLDAQKHQRLLLLDGLPLDASETWDVPSLVTSETTDYEAEAVYPGDLVKVEVYDAQEDEVFDRRGVVVAQKGSTVAAHLDELYGAFVSTPRFEVRLLGIKRRKALPIEREVRHIPQLQDKIPVGAGPTLWLENVHYILEPFYRELDESPVPVLQFRDTVFVVPDLEPPDIFWAELVVYSNESNVENLFGRLAGFLRDDASLFGRDLNYVSGVAGLLYAQQRGPRVHTIGVGAQILFGQPFAEANGVIAEVRHDYSPTQGRVVIQDDDGHAPSRSEIFRTYLYKKDPIDLTQASGLAINPATGAAWAKGDKIAQFLPIGAGVRILDLYNDPKWWYPFVRAGIMTEVEKFQTFVVSFNLDLISLVNLGLLYQFVARVRPQYTHPILLGMRAVHDDLDVTDRFGAQIGMRLYETLCDGGPANKYDDCRGDGTPWMRYDGALRYDGGTRCPADIIEFCLNLDWPGGPVRFDAGFFYDRPIVDVDGTLGAPGSTFLLTYDMDLPAGAYQVHISVRPPGVPP
jgi:hypothetical protein